METLEQVIEAIKANNTVTLHGSHVYDMGLLDNQDKVIAEKMGIVVSPKTLISDITFINEFMQNLTPGIIPLIITPFEKRSSGYVSSGSLVYDEKVGESTQVHSSAISISYPGLREKTSLKWIGALSTSNKIDHRDIVRRAYVEVYVSPEIAERRISQYPFMEIPWNCQNDNSISLGWIYETKHRGKRKEVNT